MGRTYWLSWQHWVPELRHLTTADLEAYRRHCTGMLDGMCGYTFEDGGRHPVRMEWLAKRRAANHILLDRLSNGRHDAA